ncbi:S1 family peptidase [Streptomyces sp. NPDC020681]|uniref:S1 family peptidase n=1 Tax=Streptomyces sp. NPDC020681 TaxID=3365083 RepID=UPI0037AB1B99
MSLPRRTESPRSVAVSAVAVLAVLLTWLTATGPTAHAVDRAVEVRGGDVIYSNTGGRCTVGFNTRSGSQTYALLSGRCAQGSSTWYADAARTVQIGVTQGVSFPGNDFAAIRHTNTTVTYPGEVRLGTSGGVRDITGAAQPSVGQSLCHVGRVGGYRCGIVQSVNNTVTYPEGVVYGLFRSNICSEPGDPGGPAFSGGTALGVIVGGSGNCSTGGTTFYQPVTEALSTYGLSLY